MVMKLRCLRSLILFCSFLVPTIAQAEIPTLGTIVTTSFRLGKVAIAVPPGEWEVVGVGTSRNNNNLLLNHVALAQIEGKTLKKLIFASSNEDLAKEGWVLNNECKRKDIHFSSGAQINPAWQDCWYVSHHVMTLSNNAGEHSRKAYEILASRGIQVPQTMIAAAFYKTKPGIYRSAWIYFNPETEGFPAARQAWQGNDWHKDRVVGDPARAQYVKEIIEFGRSFKPTIDAAFGR